MTAGGPMSAEALRLAARASDVALCLDFDGTLAPIVDDPAASTPYPGIVVLLGRLAARFRAVALVSGRPAAFLAERAPAIGVRYLGLYGLEEIRDGQVFVDPRLTAARTAVVDATNDLRNASIVRDSGAHLEDKVYAIAVHTRRVAQPERWSDAIDAAVRAIAERHGLEVIPGRLVWELRPAVRDDKGDAVRRVVRESGARSVVVVGDDKGDLPGFSAAQQLANEGFESLCVAVASVEAPTALLASADLIVDGPRGVYEFLTLLVA